MPGEERECFGWGGEDSFRVCFGLCCLFCYFGLCCLFFNQDERDFKLRGKLPVKKERKGKEKRNRKREGKKKGGREGWKEVNRS